MTKNQIDTSKVKELGEEIGYGHMMELASALWRKSLREFGAPESGAFVPTCESFIDPVIAKEVKTKETMALYDKIIEE